MDAAELLRQRFVDAIRRSFDPCPLIGSKWFTLLAKARPVRFRFSGTRKLAKATKSSPEAVASRLVENLDLDGLDVNVRIAENSDINVYIHGPAGDLMR